MPRKMSGIAIRTMEPSMVAINMPSVEMKRAVHLYRSSGAKRVGEIGRVVATAPENREDITPTISFLYVNVKYSDPGGTGLPRNNEPNSSCSNHI